MFRRRPRPAKQSTPWQQRVHRGYQPTNYKRPPLKRLTPLSWFLIALVFLGLVGAIGAITNRAVQGRTESLPLTDRLATAAVQHPVTVTLTPHVPVVITSSTDTAALLGTSTPTVLSGTPEVDVVTTVQSLPATEVVPTVVVPTVVVPTKMPTAIPLPSPTYDVNGAPWQDQLVRQPDGSLQAPQAVQERAKKDLLEYYTLLRNLPLADYSKKRDAILKTYFVGEALEGMRQLESKRTEYLMNRAGNVTIEVRDFSANGIAATAGIRSRNWVNDVVDVATGKVLTEGRREADVFSIVRIVYDRSSERWKFAIVQHVTEVTKQ